MRRAFLFFPFVFQFTPLREGRHVRRVKPGGHPYFNSRPSARGDRFFQRILRWLKNFNSRPSARGDRRGESAAASQPSFQFTPLREGRHLIVCDDVVNLNISIHAPPRGATKRDGDTLYLYDFNSRPSARGDCLATALSWKTTHFNSRPSARGDWCMAFAGAIGTSFQFTPLREGRHRNYATQEVNLISIHAPPRGATAKDMQFLQIFCSTLTNQHGLTIMPRNLSRLFW